MTVVTPSTSDAIPDFSRGGGLLPAIAQDAETGDVLMMAWMNAESFAETMETGYAVYFSRSRNRLWRKGEESGHRQEVVSLFVDCDADTILLKVKQKGAACHEGFRTCFFRQVVPMAGTTVASPQSEVKVVGERMVDPAQVYQKPHP